MNTSEPWACVSVAMTHTKVDWSMNYLSRSLAVKIISGQKDEFKMIDPEWRQIIKKNRFRATLMSISESGAREPSGSDDGEQYLNRIIASSSGLNWNWSTLTGTYEKPPYEALFTSWAELQHQIKSHKVTGSVIHLEERDVEPGRISWHRWCTRGPVRGKVMASFSLIPVPRVICNWEIKRIT